MTGQHFLIRLIVFTVLKIRYSEPSPASPNENLSMISLVIKQSGKNDKVMTSFSLSVGAACTTGSLFIGGDDSAVVPLARRATIKNVACMRDEKFSTLKLLRFQGLFFHEIRLYERISVM